MIGIKSFVAHRRDGKLGTVDCSLFAERVENPLIQITVLEIGRFGRSPTPHWQTFWLEIGPEQPEHRVDVNKLRAQGVGTLLKISDFKQNQ